MQGTQKTSRTSPRTYALAALAGATGFVALSAVYALAGIAMLVLLFSSSPAEAERAPAPAGESKQPLRCPGEAFVPVRDRAVRGLPTKRARELVARRGCEMRVVKRDGRDLIVTDDLSVPRVNVAVRDGHVVRVTGIY